MVISLSLKAYQSQTDMEKLGMYCISSVWNEFKHLRALQMKWRILMMVIVLACVYMWWRWKVRRRLGLGSKLFVQRQGSG